MPKLNEVFKVKEAPMDRPPGGPQKTHPVDARLLSSEAEELNGALEVWRDTIEKESQDDETYRRRMTALIGLCQKLKFPKLAAELEQEMEHKT